MRLKKYRNRKEFDEFGKFLEDPDHVTCYKGGSSSKNVTNSYTTIAPVTNIQTDKLAEALEKGAVTQAKVKAAEIALQKAKIEAELAQRQEFLETIKEGAKKTAGFVIVGGAIYFYYKNRKKGGRKK